MKALMTTSWPRISQNTAAVATLRAEQVRPVQHDEIAHARSIVS
jgi:hypothetical protein